MCHILTMEQIQSYEKHLLLAERSTGTIAKYMRDIGFFWAFLPAVKELDKEIVIRYKEYLGNQYAVSTANSMLAALNSFFVFLGLPEYRVKPFKQQRCIFRDQEKELSKAEYLRLLETAKNKGNCRLFFIMETLCTTGIRISELQHITVEAVKKGQAWVSCKGKRRNILLPKRLCYDLKNYCQSNHIVTGSIFITKNGRPMNRSNIWTEMKKLCSSAGVDANKVFPHNFRHLFAISFYNLEKDIVKLADLLGHASIQTTRIYVMESSIAHMRQVERLGLVV